MTAEQRQIARMTAAAEQAATLGPLERVTSTAALLLVAVATQAVGLGRLDPEQAPPLLNVERMMGAGLAQA